MSWLYRLLLYVVLFTFHKWPKNSCKPPARISGSLDGRVWGERVIHTKSTVPFAKGYHTYRCLESCHNNYSKELWLNGEPQNTIDEHIIVVMIVLLCWMDAKLSLVSWQGCTIISFRNSLVDFMMQSKTITKPF